MENPDLLIRLLEDVLPLKKTLASDPVYKKLHYTYEDVCGFMDDKIIHVFLKYHKTHPYEELKALTLSSLYRVKARLFRTQPVASLEDIPVPAIAQEDPEPFTGLQTLLESLSQVLSPQQVFWASVLFSPPQWVLNQIHSLDNRIPSRLFLEYFDMSTELAEIKKLNRFRKRLKVFIRNNIDPYSYKLKETT